MDDKIQYQTARHDLYRFIVLGTFLGAFIAAAGISFCVWAKYQEIGQQVFNLRTDFLGDYVNAEYAFVYNIALLITGLCIMLAMLGLYQLRHSTISHYLSFIGGWVGMMVLLAGAFPINYLDMHRTVSTLMLLGTVLMYLVSVIDRFSHNAICKGPIFGFSILGLYASISLCVQLDWNTLDFPPCSHADGDICWMAVTLWLQTNCIMLWCLSLAWAVRAASMKNNLALSKRYLVGAH
ncbi:DUF998 domain-containing protein [Shewanella youngdeokensis]|uniref:DUF998 domain-containing protein n=1 Tax=Shewanella youngdeokensis TaxID=2999068 RepID=A0ABZ0JZG6_9GAMM|nr:DUF998 domain-containing protein [Shewanella sp. DAU334]